MPLFGGKPDIEKYFKKGHEKGLIKALDYKEDRGIQKAAIEALGKLRSKHAVKPLINILNEPRHPLHKDAILALGEIGDTEAVKPLIEKLKSLLDDYAIEALINLGEPALYILTAELNKSKTVINDKIVKILLKLNNPSAAEPIIDFLRGDYTDIHFHWKTWFNETCEELLKKGNSKLSMEYISFFYVVYKNKRTYTEPGVKIIPFFDMLLNLQSIRIAGSIGENIVMSLGEFGEIDRLVNLLQSEHWYIRKTAANTLNKLTWKPKSTKEQAVYYLALGEMDKFDKLSTKIKKELLVELLESDTSQIEFYLQRRIAHILLNPGMEIEKKYENMANRILENSKEKYSKYLEAKVKSPDKYKGISDTDIKIFGDYAEFVVRITSYGQDKLLCDVKPCLNALKKLCRINKPIVGNLLHHFVNIKDTKNYSGTRYEVEYSIENPSGMTSGEVEISFEKVRRQAISALEKIGHPEYNIKLYTSRDCWIIAE